MLFIEGGHLPRLPKSSLILGLTSATSVSKEYWHRRAEQKLRSISVTFLDDSCGEGLLKKCFFPQAVNLCRRCVAMHIWCIHLSDLPHRNHDAVHTFSVYSKAARKASLKQLLMARTAFTKCWGKFSLSGFRNDSDLPALPIAFPMHLNSFVVQHSHS